MSNEIVENKISNSFFSAHDGCIAIKNTCVCCLHCKEHTYIDCLA